MYWDPSEIYDPSANHNTNHYPRGQEMDVFRRCQPTDLSNMPEKMKLMFEGESANQIFHDFEFVWWVLLVVLIVAGLTSFFYIFVMRHLAKEMMYGTIGLVVVVFAILGSLFIATGANKLPQTQSLALRSLSLHQQQTALVVGVAIIFVDLLILIAACIFGKKIALVGDIVEEAGLVLLDVPSVLLLPIVPLIFCIGWTFIWFYETMLIVSSKSIDTKVPPTFTKGERVGNLDSATQFALFYHCFAYLWVVFIAEAVTRTTIAATACAWYFTRDKDEHPSKSDQMSKWIVGQNLKRTVVYNFGSIVLGTLLTTLLTVVKIFILLIRKFHKEKKDDRTNFFLKCTGCCVETLSVVVSYINKYAYIQIALYGIPFGKAAGRSAGLISKNMGKIAIVDSVGDFMLLLCRLSVAVTCALIFKAILAAPQFAGIAFPEPLTIIAGLVSFVIATSFFGVMETTIDTILICFCEDEENNGPDSKSKQPYFMRKKLRECVERHENLMTKHGEKSDDK